MSRKLRLAFAGGIAFMALAVTAARAPGLFGFDSRPGGAGEGGANETPGKLIVHEWGTFTNFAGSDGVNLEFRPLVTNDLPPFIMTPFNQPGSPSRNLMIKQAYVALQRMETPVTYFYTERPRTVRVRVDFPKGMLSEWYPVVKQFDSGRPEGDQPFVLTSSEVKPAPVRPMGKAFLDWGAVRLLPQEQFLSVRVKDHLGQARPASLPMVGANDHYGRARETDSAIVEKVDVNKGSHFEKFLFYRGLGNFELPIKLVALGNDKFQISNSGDEASGALMLVRIENDRVRFARLDGIGPHAEMETALPAEESTVDELAAATVRELTATGLYEKESRAMVNTWRTSWFGENGTRLFYLVPQKLTDELLPLSVTPTPDETIRVLVGRLETITPEDCRRMTAALVANAADSEAVKAELATLGRFAEPALKFLVSQSRAPAEREKLEAVLAEVRPK